jgi:hypothetical protein
MEWTALSCFKSGNRRGTSLTAGQRSQMMRNCWSISCTLTEVQLIRLFVKIWENRKAALSLFLTVMWMISRTQNHIMCRLPPDLCGQSSLVVTLLLELGLGCFKYSPETKHQSVEWVAWKFQFKKPRTKIMLISPFDKQVMYHKELSWNSKLPTGNSTHRC